MKLFLKEHRLFIAIQLCQITLLSGIVLLDGYQEYGVLFYMCLLFLLLSIGYLAYTFYSRRTYYERLEKPLTQLDDSMEGLGEAPIAEALSRLLKKQYSLYESEIREVSEEQQEQLLFIDRWVHQMKTPLSVIDLTARNLEEPESSNLREETERMKTGLNTVLYMARLRTIEQDFRIGPVVLSELIREVNQENKRYFIRNQVYPTVKESRPSICVQSDEKWLLFIVTQFVQNAVKYSAGLSGNMEISIYERAEEAILEVKDYGIGIPKADQKRVFNKFFTGENGRKYRESTGMGLYLVKEVAAELDHVIEVKSTEGKGTTIRIVFRDTQNLTSV